MKNFRAVMAKTVPDDILVPSGAADQRAPSRPFAALIPILVAIAGVAAILFGGVTAQHRVVVGPAGIDPTVTGSIAKAPSLPDGDAGRARY
jgi:hypothetical protein